MAERGDMRGGAALPACAAMIERLLAGEPAGAERAELDAHLAKCGSCAAAAERLEAVDGALAELARETVTPPAFEHVRRGAEAAARARRRAQRVRRVLPFALAAAAGMAAVAIVRWPGGSPESASAQPSVVPTVAAGDVLDVTDAPARVQLGDGAQLTIESGRARIEASERAHSAVWLEHGQLALDVPRLDEGAALLVRTAEAELRVHGTRFQVGRDQAGTRVSVSDGTVEIQPADVTQPRLVLHRGEATLIEDGEHARRRARSAAIDALEHGRGAQAEASLREWLARTPPDAEAAEAHALAGWKLAADGDRAGAMAAYRRALALLPETTTPLWADNALAQLALLVERDDRAAGAELWRSYLERFPQGTHASLARAHLARRGSEEH